MGRRSRLVNAIHVHKDEHGHDDGPFIDYMLREVARRGILTDEKQLASFANAPLPLIRRILGADYAAQAAADHALVREQLLWRMVHLLPAKVGRTWPALREVLATLHAAKRLQTKVSCHLLHRSFTEAYHRRERPAESSSSRHDRLKDFWPQFHVSSRLGDEALLCEAPQLMRESSISAPSTLREVVPPRRPRSTLDWKTRSARSHCSAGSWDWLPKLPRETVQEAQVKLKAPRLETGGLGDFVRHKGQHFPKLFSESKSQPLLPALPAQTTLMQKSKFLRPWEAQLGGNWYASTKKYLSACNRDGLLPSTDPFVTGHSDCIKAKSQGLGDRDVFAICEMLEMGSPVRELDLENNPGVTEKAFSHLFQFFLRPGETRDLQRLSLSGCVSLAQDEVFSQVLQLLNAPSLNGLQELKLSGLPVGVKWQVPLCKAIRNHPSLRSLSLADTGLGTRASGDEDDNTMACVVELLSSKNIVHLDLSWNCFGAVGFDILGRKLVELDILEKLDLHHCSTLSKRSPWTSSMVYLLEHLRDNKSLQYLNISGNYLDFRAALVLEDSLEYNKCLRELDVSNNSLGNAGMRSLLRVLARDTSGLQCVIYENCAKGIVVNARSDMVFRASRPHGRYDLDLTRPYDRSLLRMLYKTADRLDMPFDQTFREVSNLQHPPKSSNGLYQVPSTGKAALTFTMDKVLEDKTSRSCGSHPEFDGVLRCHSELLRMRPKRKMVTLLAQWRRMDGLAEEQSIMIDALSKDFSLNYPEIYVLCQSRAQSWNVIASLQCTLPNHRWEMYMCLRLIPSSCDYVRMLQASGAWFSFNALNPTGHYRLELSSPVDYAVAERLAILDNWESSVRRAEGKPDVSQVGNFSHARNVQFSNCPLPRSFTEWIPAEYDVLELDYSSSRRPCASGLPTACFEELLRSLMNFASSGWKSRLQALRQLSSEVALSCLQLREMLDLFEPMARRHVVACFYNRLVDIQNEKLFRARLDTEEVSELLSQLGPAACFPYIQPEQMQIRLHLKNYDERLLMSLLLKLAMKENLMNLKGPQMTNSDGTVDNLVLGVPRTWEQMANVPKQGIFEATYACSPEDRNLKVRRDLLGHYGGWSVPEEVCVVSFLQKVPQDVKSLLAFLLVTCGSLLEASSQLSSPMSSRDFEDGCKRLGFTRFQGQGEIQRFLAVFRYIDSKGEGRIGSKEFARLQDLEQELKLLASQMLRCCRRLFGSAAWESLAEADELGLLEWKEAWEAMKYHGEVVEVFRLFADERWGPLQFQQMERLAELAELADCGTDDQEAG